MKRSDRTGIPPDAILCRRRIGIRSRGGFPMMHRGVEYTVSQATPGFWNWQFRMGDAVISGKTATNIRLLAIRRVQLRIDRELKKAAPKGGDRT